MSTTTDYAPLTPARRLRLLAFTSAGMAPAEACAALGLDPAVLTADARLAGQIEEGKAQAVQEAREKVRTRARGWKAARWWLRHVIGVKG